MIPQLITLLATQLTNTSSPATAVAPTGPVQVHFDADAKGVALELQTGSAYTEGSAMSVGRRGITTTHYSNDFLSIEETITSSTSTNTHAHIFLLIF